MIEHSYRGYVVERRGNMCHIPSIGVVVANETQAHQAIDRALAPPPRIDREQEELRQRFLEAGVEP